MGTIGERIREILKRKDWSGRRLSREAGLADTYVNLLIQRFEKNPGTSVETATMEAVARAGGVSLRWLLTGAGDPDADDDAATPSHTESVVPQQRNLVGWEDSLVLARLLEPDLFARAQPGDLEIAGRIYREFPQAPTPQLVVDSVRMALRYQAMAQSGEVDRLRQEALARAAARRAAQDAKDEAEMQALEAKWKAKKAGAEGPEAPQPASADPAGAPAPKAPARKTRRGPK